MYRVFLTIHIVAIISWMAGILYLLRLVIYHRIETESVVKTRFETMEMRLYKYITIPAMLVSYCFGTMMLIMQPSLLEAPWMHIKLGAVVALTGVTHFAKKLMRELKAGTCTMSEKSLRLLNELPTILMILIVSMVILRPF